MWNFSTQMRVLDPVRKAARPVLGFVVDQIKKTIHNPKRIPVISRRLVFRMARPVVAHLMSRNLSRRLLAAAFPSQIETIDERLAFAEANSLLQQNRPVEALRTLEKCAGSDEPHVLFLRAVCLLVGVGRLQEAMSVFTRANDVRRRKARSFGLENHRLRVLPTIWSGNFGHLAQLDYVVKLGILEGRTPDDTVLYVAPGTPQPNPFLLEQWRPYLRIVKDPADLPLPEEQISALEFDFLAPRLPDGTTVQMWQVAARTYRQWYAEKRGPLLSIPAEIDGRGHDALRCLGIPSDAWFVVLHVRERGSKPLHADLHNVLNCRPETYLPAVEEITSRGGWVIRIGDPSMTPFPPLPRVVDYCHSDLRADWMDVFLCARARFFLGTSSGPAYVPPAYGVPSVLTNWWPPAQRPWHPSDIFIPKLHRSLRSGKILSLAETLAEPFGFCNSVDYLRDAAGVTIEDSDSEDIRLAVAEMFERLEGRAIYDEVDKMLRERADQIYMRHGAVGLSVLARDFLRKKQNFVSTTDTKNNWLDGR